MSKNVQLYDWQSDPKYQELLQRYVSARAAADQIEGELDKATRQAGADAYRVTELEILAEIGDASQKDLDKAKQTAEKSAAALTELSKDRDIKTKALPLLKEKLGEYEDLARNAVLTALEPKYKEAVRKLKTAMDVLTTANEEVIALAEAATRARKGSAVIMGFEPRYPLYWRLLRKPESLRYDTEVSRWYRDVEEYLK